MTTVAQYGHLKAILNEKQWRQYLATEAQVRGNCALVAREAGVSVNTIKRGALEIAQGESFAPGDRVRAKGAGPKRKSETEIGRAHV